MMGNTFRAQESEEQLLPILFDVPAEGRGEFMTTAQTSERLVPMATLKNLCHSTVWAYYWAQLGTKM